MIQIVTDLISNFLLGTMLQLLQIAAMKELMVITDIINFQLQMHIPLELLLYLADLNVFQIMLEKQ